MNYIQKHGYNTIVDDSWKQINFIMGHGRPLTVAEVMEDERRWIEARLRRQQQGAYYKDIVVMDDPTDDEIGTWIGWKIDTYSELDPIKLLEEED